MLTFDAYAALLRPILLAMQKESGEAPCMLARRLNQRGMPTLNATRWTEAQVLAVLRRPAAMPRDAGEYWEDEPAVERR